MASEHSNVPGDPAGLAKQAAARYAIERYVSHSMALGLGSGTTAAYAVEALAARMAREKLDLRCIISTSYDTAALARSLGLSLLDDLTLELGKLDVTIDGADEVDENLALIKGGGGALLREKLVAAQTVREVIIVDPRKRAAVLGLIHPLPVVIVPYAWQTTQRRVEELCGRPAPLRLGPDSKPFLSDDHLYTLDVATGEIPDPGDLEKRLKAITGVVDCGLFVGSAACVIVGHPDGRIEEIQRG